MHVVTKERKREKETNEEESISLRNEFSLLKVGKEIFEAGYSNSQLLLNINVYVQARKSYSKIDYTNHSPQ